MSEMRASARLLIGSVIRYGYYLSGGAGSRVAEPSTPRINGIGDAPDIAAQWQRALTFSFHI